jgi:hypothetical protein
MRAIAAYGSYLCSFPVTNILVQRKGGIRMKPLDNEILEVKMTLLIETHMIQKNTLEVETFINQMVKELSSCLGVKFQTLENSREISSYPRNQDLRFKRITHFLKTE